MKLTPSSGETLQRADGFVMIGGRSPYAFAGDAHGPETKPMNGEIAADCEGAGVGGVGR